MCSTVPRRNVAQVYRQATRAEREAGFAWYADARDLAVSLAQAHKREPREVCAVLAVLSPGISWEACVEATRKVLRDEDVKTARYQGYRSNWRKAQAILFEGADIARVVSGNKVRAFYRLLLNGGDQETVCVDTICLTAAVKGHVPTVWQVDGSRSITAAGLPRIDRYEHYERIAAAYRKVAWEQGALPCQIQATVWLAMKRIGGRGNA